MRERIEAGVWAEGQQLPTEQDLMRQYDVSRVVVNQALGNLAREGLIERHRGRGTFVAHRKTSMNQLQSWAGSYEDLLRSGLEPVTQVIEKAVVAAAEPFSKFLEVEAGEPLLYLHRLRLERGNPDRPVALLKTHIVLSRAPGLAHQSFENESLYRVLERLGAHIQSHRRLIDAVPASREEAKRLSVLPGAPLIRFRNVSFLSGEVPLEYFITLYRADRIQFELGLTRSSDQGMAVEFYRQGVAHTDSDSLVDLLTAPKGI